MERLENLIRRAIREDRVVFSIHADNQLVARGVLRWHAVIGFEEGELLSTHPHDRPNPKIRMRQLLPNGEEVVAVWSYVKSIDSAKLVIVYFQD